MALVFVNWELSATTEAEKESMTSLVTAAVVKNSNAKGALVAFQDMKCYPAAPGPVIFVNWTEGQLPQVKDAMVQGITEAVCTATGVSPKGVKIIFNDVPRGDLGNDGRIINRNK